MPPKQQPVSRHNVEWKFGPSWSFHPPGKNLTTTAATTAAPTSSQRNGVRNVTSQPFIRKAVCIDGKWMEAEPASRPHKITTTTGKNLTSTQRNGVRNVTTQPPPKKDLRTRPTTERTTTKKTTTTTKTYPTYLPNSAVHAK